MLLILKAISSGTVTTGRPLTSTDKYNAAREQSEEEHALERARWVQSSDEARRQERAESDAVILQVPCSTVVSSIQSLCRLLLPSSLSSSSSFSSSSSPFLYTPPPSHTHPPCKFGGSLAYHTLPKSKSDVMYAVSWRRHQPKQRQDTPI